MLKMEMSEACFDVVLLRKIKNALHKLQMEHKYTYRLSCILRKMERKVKLQSGIHGIIMLYDDMSFLLVGKLILMFSNFLFN